MQTATVTFENAQTHEILNTIDQEIFTLKIISVENFMVLNFHSFVKNFNS